MTFDIRDGYGYLEGEPNVGLVLRQADTAYVINNGNTIIIKNRDGVSGDITINELMNRLGLRQTNNFCGRVLRR